MIRMIRECRCAMRLLDAADDTASTRDRPFSLSPFLPLSLSFTPYYSLVFKLIISVSLSVTIVLRATIYNVQRRASFLP